MKQTYKCNTGSITTDRLKGSISAALLSPRVSLLIRLLMGQEQSRGGGRGV